MPLAPGSSESTISKNIAEMRSAGHPERVAVAAALSNADRHPRADGGASMGAIETALAISRANRIPKPKVSHDRGIDFKGGLITAAVHGRTDKIPLNIASGSYVLPADTVSALGQGNTLMGAKVIQEIMKGAPYRADGSPYGASTLSERGPGAPGIHPGTPPAPPANQEHLGDVEGPEPPHMKRGGESLVPIIAAGGEYVLSPHEVKWLGGGDISKGHQLLDEFVKKVRKKNVETLRSLPGPKR